MPGCWLQRLLPLFLAGALSACTTLGPDFAEPEFDWLAAWQSNLYGQALPGQEQAELDLQFWWRAFDDPVLESLIATARAHNPSLRLAGLRIAESRALLGIAVGSRYPQQQQAVGTGTYLETRRGAPASNDGQSSYDVGFNVGWELDFWGRFQRGIEGADAAFFASVANQQDAQVLLSAQVADFYFAYRTIEQRIVIARQNLSIQNRSLEITERLFDSGEQSELDVQQARTQYLATLASIPGLEINQNQLRNAIGALLGRAPGELPELTPALQPLPVIEPVMVTALPAQLLLRRPDIRTAAYQVAVSSANVGIAQTDLYPRISLFGSIGWLGDSAANSDDFTRFAVGPGLSWNLLNYGRLRNNVRVQDARLQQSITAYEQSLLQAAREIDDAAIAVVKTREQQAPLLQSVQAAERSLELSQTRYREGYADFQRVLDAQRALAAQTESQVINQGLHLSAVVDFYKALGGGWRPATANDLIPETVRSQMRERSNWGELLEADPPAVPPPGNKE